MPKLTEFYEELQGRPASKIFRSLGSRVLGIPSSYIKGVVLKIVEDEMKEELQKILSELSKALTELKQIKLHLASGSDEHIDEESSRGD